MLVVVSSTDCRRFDSRSGKILCVLCISTNICFWSERISWWVSPLTHGTRKVVGSVCRLTYVHSSHLRVIECSTGDSKLRPLVLYGVTTSRLSNVLYSSHLDVSRPQYRRQHIGQQRQQVESERTSRHVRTRRAHARYCALQLRAAPRHLRMRTRDKGRNTNSLK